MIVRSFAEEDLEECLGISPARIGQEIIGYERALSAWRAMVKSTAFRSVVVEAPERVAGHRIVAFGASVFVSSAFARAEISNPRPGMNGRVIASIDGGESIVLDHSELRHQNTFGGLCQVILFSTWRRACLTATQVTDIQVKLSMSYAEVFSGYRLELMLFEATDQVDLEYARATGVYRLVGDFEDMHTNSLGDGWGRQGGLAVIDRTSALTAIGSLVSTFFNYNPPVLRFSEVDQQLLEAALGGLTDDELALRLRLKTQTVKKRWAHVFSQVEDVMPNLLPGCAHVKHGTRGPQKRHHLLAYLRRHPEELRPFMR